MIQKRGLRLSSGDPFVSRRRVLVYRHRGLQRILASTTQNSKVFPSLLAPGYSWNPSSKSSRLTGAVGTGPVYSPFVQADLHSYQI